MQNSFLVFLIGIAFVFSLVQCANPIPLEGGPKDTTAPGIDSLRSTPNMQTNFKQQDIEITFDEWVQLNNVFQQVVISPPLEPRPEIVLRGKTVKVLFDEATTLRENATYTINFGEAVQDLTERNSADDLRFVFATGDYIDSLEVKGTLLDAEKNEPQEAILVMLYDNLADTVVRTENPFYFGKTDKAGRFHIQNVRADTFKVFALEDGNSNYKYDTGERIGFLDTVLVVADSSENIINLELFTPEKELAILAIDSVHYGRADFLFNQNLRLEELTFAYEDVLPVLDFETNKDTLHVWYDLGERTNWQLIVQKDTTLSDTFRINGNNKTTFLAGGKLRTHKKLSEKQNLHSSKAFTTKWNHPLASFDTSQMLLYTDTLRTPLAFELEIDSSTANRRLKLKHAWRETADYFLEMLPGALTDIYGLSLKDTIRQTISVQEDKKFGNLQLRVVGLDSTQHYLLEVLLGTETIIEERLQNIPTFETEIKGLKIGAYSAKIVKDINKNGYWDTGNYELKRQAEPIFTKKLEPIRANWDIEATVDINE